MSSPIAIPRTRSSASSSSSSSVSSSPAMSSAPTSPPASLYVPLHKRASSSQGSSRASSPAQARISQEAKHPQIYSTDFLLSLRPTADESMKEKMRASCPEVVMNRRMRKSVDFHEHEHAKAQPLHQRLEAAAQPRHNHQHQHSEPPHSEPSPTVASVVPTSSPAPQARRVPPRGRPAGRSIDRRRQALGSRSAARTTTADSWRGMRITSFPLAVV
jgi:hypothetical protein